MLDTGKMTRDLWLLIIFNALRQVTMLFFSTFFISYLMQLATNEILAVSSYKLFEFAATAVGFFIFANWCKRHNKVTLFAMNAVPKVILLIMILALGDGVINYIMPMGILFGIGAAMFHLPMHVMVGEKVAPKSMSRYVGAKNAATYTTQILAPVILGIFITVGSYREMAWALLALTVVEIILCAFITPSHHRIKAPVDFIGFLRCILRFPVVRRIMLGEILRGFSMGSALTSIITMYTVYMFQTDLNLGIFTTIFSICSILTSVFFGRWGRRQNFPTMLTVCTLMLLGAMTLFILKTTPATFLVYNFVSSTAVILLGLICDTNTYNMAQSRCVGKNHRVEYFVFRDGALFIGRWAAFVTLMYISVFGDASWLRYYLGAVTIVGVICGILAVRISPHIRNR